MFTKNLRKIILEHDWVDIMKRSSNTTQTWRRIRDEATRGLNDLTLLAKKLPDDKQQEIFDNKISDFLSAILGIDPTIGLVEHQPNLRYLDPRTTKLAAELANIALNFCIYQHEFLLKDMPTQLKLTTEQLLRSEKICDELAYKLRITKLEEDSREENLIYLFEWNELKRRGRHRDRFTDFLSRLCGTQSFHLYIDDFKFTYYAITCKFTIEGFYPGTAYMKRNKDNSSATLSMTIPEEVNGNFHDKVLNFELLIKNEQNMSHLYIKSNDIAKKKRRHRTIPIG
jgi:hypothetical protein